MKKETLTVYDGNGRKITKTPPTILILGFINAGALTRLNHNTGLQFKKVGWGYMAKADNFKQIAKLLFTYNFKTQYFNNADYHNTLMLKFAHYPKDWD